MTYDDFFKIVMELFCEDMSWWPDGNEEYYEVRWITGGASGGTCWGDEPHYFSVGDPEEEIDLTQLFDRVCPAMTYKQHKKIMDAVTEASTDYIGEYYGNYTDYGIKRVRYRELYDALVTEGVISND